MLRRVGVVGFVLASLATQPAGAAVEAGADVRASGAAAGPYAFVAGRRDANVTVVDVGRALDPANDGTPNAIVSEAKTAADMGGEPRGDPANIAVSADGRVVIAVNHTGNADQAAIADFAHGWPGTLAIMDVAKAMDPANNLTANALIENVPTWASGAVGLALTADGEHMIVGHAETDLKETGGRDLTVLKFPTGELVHRFKTGLGTGGRIPNAPGYSCPELAADPAKVPKRYPDANVGCFTETNAIGVARGHLFTANGGTDDVGVIDMQRLLAGRADAEVARIPVQVGPWGLDVSPDQSLVVVANRESGEFSQLADGVAPREGRTISILDTERAIAGGEDAVLATSSTSRSESRWRR